MNQLKTFFIKNSPEILMSLGLSGLLFSIVYSVKATKEADKNIQEAKKILNKDKLNTKEIIKYSWKPFLPVILSTTISVPCIICGNRIYSKKSTALAAAYAISETALHEYQTKVKEIIGDKKEKTIQESISKDKVEKTYTPNTQIIMTGDGDSLFYEPYTGRYFRSNWNKIMKSANRLNADAISGLDTITLNDWFNEIGLDSTDLGNYLGWEVVNGPNSLLDISLNSSLTVDGTPCGAIYYNKVPTMLY